MKAWLIGVVSIIFVIIGTAIYYNLNNFPAPRGKFGVAKMEQYLIDTSRIETNQPGTHRELMLHIWYPSATRKASPQAPYDPDALENALEFMHQQSSLPTWLMNGLRGTKTYAQYNKKIAADTSMYPVIIATHGSGTMIQHYTSLWEELASHGYIVIGINHPYMAAVTRFPDGRIINSFMPAKQKESKVVARAWKKEQFEVMVIDVKFVIDNLIKLNKQPDWLLYNKLDIDNLGMCGHSGGGSLTMRMCLEDKRIKAGVALDSTTRGNYALEPFDTPFLVLLCEKSHAWAGEEGKQDLKKLNVLCHKPGMNMNIITFKNVGHATFIDLPLLLHTTLLTQMLSRVIHIDLDTSSAQASNVTKIAKKYVMQFFDKYLKNQSTTLFGQSNCNLYADEKLL